MQFKKTQKNAFGKKIMQSFANLYAYVGGYVYDETYGIEPEPMGIFIDAEKSLIKDKNILDFVKNSFSALLVWNEYFDRSMPKDGNLLKPYAIQNDLPCVVFNWNKM